MSYCRNNGEDSDVYVIMTRDSITKRIILQCFCADPCNTFATRSGMIAHLRAHQDQGLKVPGRAFDRLQREIREEGDIIPQEDHGTA